MQALVDRTRKAVSHTLPAPVGGLNAREPLAAMPPGDASLMVNLFANATSVATRKGHEAFADGTSLFGTAMSNTFGFYKLMVWTAGSSSKLFTVLLGATAAPELQWKIYEVSALGALTLSHTITSAINPSPIETSTMGENTMFVTGSSTPYLIATLGDNDATYIRAFDGSAWSTPSITGLPTTGCLGLNAHRHRLWFYGTDLTVYYLPVGAIAGAVTAFNLGTLFNKGGRVVSMRTWTIDGGDGGTDDLAAFLTDNGQLALYSGYDPASSATWQLIGVFDVGGVASQLPGEAPSIRGGAFMLKLGADLLMVLDEGVMSASKILRNAQASEDYSVSGKINPLIRDAAAIYGRNGSAPIDLWCLTHHPRLKQLLLNIPTALAAVAADGRCASFQYVMNTETGAWQKFTDMGYLDAVIWNGEMYMIAGGYYVYRYGTVNADLGTAITFEARQAYNYLESPENKHVTLMQPMTQWTGAFSMAVEMDSDFNGGTISAYKSYTAANVSPWLSPNEFGRALAVHLKGQTSVGVGTWYATNLAVIPSAGVV